MTYYRPRSTFCGGHVPPVGDTSPLSPAGFTPLQLAIWVGHVAPTISIDFDFHRRALACAQHHSVDILLAYNPTTVSGWRTKIKKLNYCYEFEKFKKKVVYDHLITTRISEI